MGDEHPDYSRLALMTTSERGAYELLSDLAWFESPPATIPDDDFVLARWAGLNALEWGECKRAVLSCFTLVADRRLQLPWLRTEYDRAQQARREGTERACAQRARIKRAECAQHSNSESSPDSSPSPVPHGTSEELPAGAREVRLLWNQASPLHAEYPKHRRGPPRGPFMRFVEPAWGSLLERGVADPQPMLLKVLRAYAASHQATVDGGRACVGPEKFFAHQGVWTQDPADWGPPAPASPTIDTAGIAARAAAAEAKRQAAKIRRAS